MSVLPKKKQRAFSGLAGSPLSVITTGQPKRGRGRPRKYASDAERMRANRKAEKHEAQQTPKYWNKVLADAGLSVSQGLFVKQADPGKGLLVTGGWDTDKICDVVAASERDGKTIDDMDTGGGGSGRRVKPKGHGITSSTISMIELYEGNPGGPQETAESSVQKHEKGFQTKNWKTPPKKEWKAKMVCPAHPELPLQAAVWDPKTKLFVLECGCSRPLGLE